MRPAPKRKSPPKRKSRATRPSLITTLAEISIALSASRDPDRVLAVVAESAARLSGCQRSAICLLRHDSHQRLEVAYTTGVSDAFITTLQQWLTETPGRLEAVTAHEPRLVPNLAKSDLTTLEIKHYHAEGIYALASLPLLTQGDGVGQLILYFNATRRFLKSEVELLRSFGSQAGLAIANARVYAEIEEALIRYSQQLQAIKAINRELNSTLDLQRLLEVVVERAQSYTNAQAACLHLREPDRNRLALAVARGITPEVLGLPDARSLIHLLAVRAQRTGRPEVVPDLQQDSIYLESPNHNRSHLSVPVRHEAMTLGVITLQDPRPGLFTEDQVSFVTQLAAQAAIAITNARLFSEVSENHDRMQAVLDSTREGVLVIDSLGRIALVNSRIEEMWKMRRQELVGQNLADLIQRPSLGIPAKLGFSTGELLELLINLSQNLDIQPSKLTYQLDSHLPYYLERSGTAVIDENNRVTGWVLVLRDVSEEKQTEIAREELTSLIVHDLRTPMTSVLGSLKLIEDLYVPSDENGILKETVDISLRASKKMVVLVDSLLDIFKTETSKMEIRPQAQPLPTLVTNIITEFATLAAMSEVRLINQVPDNLPFVLVEGEKIERVLTNLVDNALKFTPAQGDVTVKATPIADRVGLPGIPGHEPCVLVEISDSGPGIPPEYQDRIFDRYVQVRGREGRRRGTGLGLAFCKLAIEAHGGQIWVETRPEGGSVFRFTLPLATADQNL